MGRLRATEEQQRSSEFLCDPFIHELRQTFVGLGPVVSCSSSHRHPDGLVLTVSRSETDDMARRVIVVVLHEVVESRKCAIRSQSANGQHWRYANLSTYPIMIVGAHTHRGLSSFSGNKIALR